MLHLLGFDIYHDFRFRVTHGIAGPAKSWEKNPLATTSHPENASLSSELPASEANAPACRLPIDLWLPDLYLYWNTGIKNALILAS